MYRKYINDLNAWLIKPNRKPLLVWGARQTGKTYLIKNLFAEENFKGNYIYVDCQDNYDFVDFCYGHPSINDVLNYLSLSFDKVINEKTLLIFDEAQECLPIITLMKYFYQDYPEIPVIVTGSMVRMKLKRTITKRGNSKHTSFMFPVGKINELTIYPLNFEEFLINRNKILYKTIVDSYNKKQALDEFTHQKAIDVFHEYLLVGGMPEALDIFLKTGNFQLSREALKELYNNYLADMDLYQASPEAIIRSKKTFEIIYSQLNKETRNFKAGDVEHNLRNRDLLSSLDWLTMTFLVMKSQQIKENVTLPLISNNDSLYRLYLSDMGIFTYQSGVNATNFISKTGRNALSGIFFENYVAIELTNQAIPLYYWVGKNNAEFEFLINYNNSVIPIDVKKGRGSLNSLEKFKNHNSYLFAIKISENKYGYDNNNKILTIPIYDTFLLAKSLSVQSDFFNSYSS